MTFFDFFDKHLVLISFFAVLISVLIYNLLFNWITRRDSR